MRHLDFLSEYPRTYIFQKDVNKTNFGGEPLQATPHMAIYGYDTGMYLLKSLGADGLINEDTPLYKGIQTSVRWERGDNWRGLTNQAIEIVHFSPDHQITVNVQ